MLATAQALRPSNVLKKIGSVKSALERFDSEVRLHHYRIREYEPNVHFRLDKGHFIVKTAENGADLEACLKLRFDVFHREYKKKNRTFGVDIDKLDEVCDHVMIIDKRIDQVIGTYRLNASMFTDTFYSMSEFHMDWVVALEGNKLELGRACIGKAYRNGVVIALLWRGIAEYIQKTNIKILFGCSSVKTMEPLEIGLVTKYLKDEGHLITSSGIAPTRKYKVKQLDRVMEYIEQNQFEYCREEVEASIPALFHSYLKAGAKVYGEPAIDRDFNCIDYLVVLKIDELSPLMKGKYKV